MPQNRYDVMAAHYDADVSQNPINSLYAMPNTLALLPDVSDRRVLDAGCGSGYYTVELVGRGARVVAVDASAQMLQIARRRLGADAPVDWHTADLGEPLGFLPDSAVDVVLAPLVLHYLRDWSGPLAEFRRVLRPGGVLVASVHHPFCEFELSGSDDYFAVEQWSEMWIKGGLPVTMTFWRRPLEAMLGSLAEAGFGLDVLREPQPLPEAEARSAEVWRALTTRPRFLFLRLTVR
ncbi:MAG TPA: class I SAM-dependent methyltransferase [Mycobacteriales bacterium]|nr:class I SAM-dependent methyltransferase [Mycobacteriales bacterium]